MGFQFIGPRTPCPHPTRLRQFWRDRNRTPATEFWKSSAAAAWASSTRPAIVACSACRLEYWSSCALAPRPLSAWPGFAPRPRPSPGFHTPTSCKSTKPESTRAALTLYLVDGGSLDQQLAQSPTSPAAAAFTETLAVRTMALLRMSVGSSIAISNRPTSCWPSWAVSRRSPRAGKPIRNLCRRITGRGA